MGGADCPLQSAVNVAVGPYFALSNDGIATRSILALNSKLKKNRFTTTNVDASEFGFHLRN